MMRHAVRTCLFVAALGLSTVLTPQAQAQNPFEAIIRVNEQAITRFELDQRTRMLALFRTPGDVEKLARKQLIEDRIKLQAAQTQGIAVTDIAIEDAMAEFAGRGNVQLEDMITSLEAAGVDPSTFREFIRAGITWRDLVAARFSGQISVNDDDMERARRALTGRSGVRVLLSEIVIPRRPGQEEAQQERAEALSEITSIQEFATAARQFSAAPSRATGGKMDWLLLSELPAGLRSVVLDLSPGKVSDPIPTQQAFILLQMRDIQEVSVAERQFSAIEYATYFLPGGRNEATLQEAENVKNKVNTCDDLFGVAKGQPEEVLERHSKAPDEIPQDIALQLAQLDEGEISTALTRANGSNLMVLMLCGRTPVLEGSEDGPTEQQLTEFIRSSQFDSLSNSYLAQLMAEARIIEK